MNVYRDWTFVINELTTQSPLTNTHTLTHSGRMVIEPKGQRSASWQQVRVLTLIQGDSWTNRLSDVMKQSADVCAALQATTEEVAFALVEINTATDDNRALTALARDGVGTAIACKTQQRVNFGLRKRFTYDTCSKCCT